MKHILHIFRKDVTGLSRNLFALVIAGGLCIIPSLYAWFNIYSNWDPYANTSSLKVAVVSEDSGFSSKGSDPVNMGNQVLEQLHDNTGVGWVFPQDTDAALEGVYDGSYYAAIIIGDDFSRSLFDFLDNGMKHPSVTYYENSKKNAVATKITDTASSTLQQTINTEFINVAAQTALSGLESRYHCHFPERQCFFIRKSGIHECIDSGITGYFRKFKRYNKADTVCTIPLCR